MLITTRRFKRKRIFGEDRLNQYLYVMYDAADLQLTEHVTAEKYEYRINWTENIFREGIYLWIAAGRPTHNLRRFYIYAATVCSKIIDEPKEDEVYLLSRTAKAHHALKEYAGAKMEVMSAQVRLPTYANATSTLRDIRRI